MEFKIVFSLTFKRQIWFPHTKIRNFRPQIRNHLQIGATLLTSWMKWQNFSGVDFGDLAKKWVGFSSSISVPRILNTSDIDSPRLSSTVRLQLAIFTLTLAPRPPCRVPGPVRLAGRDYFLWERASENKAVATQCYGRERGGGRGKRSGEPAVGPPQRPPELQQNRGGPGNGTGRGDWPIYKFQ